jgi:hypothetical protein
MTPAEIGHRVVKAAATQAEAWGFVRCEVPAADLTWPSSPWIHADARVNPSSVLDAADRVIAGRYDVFALEDVDLGSPPRWNRDPKTGIEAPLDFGKTLDYRDPSRVGDCKYLWEPNRHLHLVTLAQAYALTSQPCFAAALRDQLDSWFIACPFRMGVNWSSSLEAALRLINWSAAWHLVGGTHSRLFEGEDGEAFRQRWLVSVYQHAEFIAGHLSLHSSANNHLIGEVAGLYTAGVTWPHWPRAAQWRANGKAILEREALLQNAPDGVNREQAVSYLQWELDLLLIPLFAARANGDDFAPAYAARIEAMMVYLASIMDFGGNVPMFGDADDGFVVRLDPRPGFCRYRSLLATGALLFGRGDLKAKAGGLDDKTRWLLGVCADADFACLDTSAARLPIRREFPDGGYYVLGADFETPGGNPPRGRRGRARLSQNRGPRTCRRALVHALRGRAGVPRRSRDVRISHRIGLALVFPRYRRAQHRADRRPGPIAAGRKLHVATQGPGRLRHVVHESRARSVRGMAGRLRGACRSRDASAAHRAGQARPANPGGGHARDAGRARGGDLLPLPRGLPRARRRKRDRAFARWESAHAAPSRRRRGLGHGRLGVARVRSQAARADGRVARAPFGRAAAAHPHRLLTAR